MTREEEKDFMEEYRKINNEYEEEKRRINSRFFANEKEWFDDITFESYENVCSKAAKEFAEKALELAKKYHL